MGALSAQFNTGQVLTAADVTNSALQSWIRRNLIIGHKDTGRLIEMPGAPGVRRKFSFFNVMEIAIAKALIELGVELVDAFKAASDFAHVGDDKRLPSMLYQDEGHTLLCVAGQLSDTVLWKPNNDILAEIRHRLNYPSGWVTLEVMPVFDRVTVALGYHPEAVLAEAYGEG